MKNAWYPFLQVVNGGRLANDEIGLDLHDTKFAQILDLLGDNRLGESELGDAVAQHAAGLVQGLEDGHVVARLGAGGSRRNARGA